MQNQIKVLEEANQRLETKLDEVESTTGPLKSFGKNAAHRRDISEGSDVSCKDWKKIN